MENNTNVLLFLQVHFHTAPVNTLEKAVKHAQS